SLGILTPEKADRLRKAGVDRVNHNLETSEHHFGRIVTTHQYTERLSTVQTIKDAGMEVCCGGIVGMGEADEDVVGLAFALRTLGVDSVPVNFFDPRPGTPLESLPRPSPRWCLKVLAMFRLVHPRADVRAAGGREACLRSLQPFALCAVSSIFTSGYLTTPGMTPAQDHQMIADLGFEIEEEPPLLT
ncbi:MAG: biotin synthase BioB, partial [Pseudomonadota bacterium]